MLEIKNLGKYYPSSGFFQRRSIVKALDGVSFSVEKGKTIAVVGESGCGKSTLAKTILQMEKANFGEVYLHGKSWLDIPLHEYRKKVQMVFQDPYASINPRKKVFDIIAEPLIIQGKKTKDEIQSAVFKIMEQVGLRKEFSERYPHMFSGGQRQRIGIARALILQPNILLCDEPVSALDISIQAQILNLLMDLQDQNQLTYIFITHNLSIVEHIADTVIVMYLGKIVEKASRDILFSSPKHPYTKALLSSTPEPHKENRKQEIILQGDLPSPLNPPTGCGFHTRCPIASSICKEETPILRTLANSQDIACHNIEEATL